MRRGVDHIGHLTQYTAERLRDRRRKVEILDKVASTCASCLSSGNIRNVRLR